MPLLFSSLRLHEIHHLKNLLEAEGIRCHIRNELLSRLAGEIPFTECAPELWLLDPGDGERARQIVGALFQGVSDAPSWTCAQCGEMLEGQFGACWKCGAARGAE